MIAHAAKIKLMKEHGRHRRLDDEAERRLLEGAKVCTWRRRTFELFYDIVILMQDTGMRNQRELYRMRIENLDWENRVIFVTDSKTTEITAPKTSQEKAPGRTLSWSQNTSDTLRFSRGKSVLGKRFGLNIPEGIVTPGYLPTSEIACRTGSKVSGSRWVSPGHLSPLRAPHARCCFRQGKWTSIPSFRRIESAARAWTQTAPRSPK